MITIKNLTKTYNAGKKNECIALRNIDLTIQNGECVAIVGKSGSGKTTLLHIIAGVEKNTSGKVNVDGIQVDELTAHSLAKYRSKHIGILTQSFNLIDECTALENVMLPLNLLEICNKERKVRAIALIKGVGLGDRITEKVRDMSGGEKQRIAISRALVTNAENILADEPTGALDTKTSQEIIDMLLRINKKGKTIIIVTHDPIVASRCSRRIELADGEIVSDTPQQQNLES
ncbi:MAG: ABC transporter ATP-binding protein [Christensenellaceae bacterium]|jgi:ABC-type lipoprotein export system ATPase subunit|nr:ABC transporter ATP-binding protein [Christensenellaceae bacterium]